MLLVYLAGVVPLLLLALLTSTVLAFTQPAEPGAPRALTRAQARAQLSTWGAMAALGLFTVDFGDTEDSTRSVLTQVLGTGEAVLGVSVALWVGAAVATVVAWVVLVVTLTAGRRRLAA